MNTAKKAHGAASLLAVLALGVAPLAQAEVTATEGWVQATTPGTDEAAVHLVLTNTGDQERSLMKIVSPVTDEVILHRSSGTPEGTIRMWPLSGLELEAGETLRMHPDGVHVMLKALKQPLVAGEKVAVSLKFDGGQPEFTVMLDVRPPAPAAARHAH